MSDFLFAVLFALTFLFQDCFCCSDMLLFNRQDERLATSDGFSTAKVKATATAIKSTTATKTKTAEAAIIICITGDPVRLKRIAGLPGRR